MKVLELSKNNGNVAADGRHPAKVAAFEFEHKGNGAYKGIIPLRLATGVVRNTAISITGQAQTTQAGASRLLLKVDVPYAAKPVDAVDGVVREYGAISAHIVLTIPRRATQDMSGANGSDATAMARRQADYALALLLRAFGSTSAKDTRRLFGATLEAGELILSYPGAAGLANGLESEPNVVSEEGNRFVTSRWPVVPSQSENEVDLKLGPADPDDTAAVQYAILDKMTAGALSPVSAADKSSASDPTACVDLTVNTTLDDALNFGPAAMLTRALHGLNPLPDDTVLASPTYLRGEF